MKYNTLNINIRIGSFIRKHRILLGMSGKNLGQKLGVSQQHISRLERGQTVFSFELILHLLNAIDKSISDLIAEVLYEDSTYENLIIYQHESHTDLILAN